MMKTHLPSLNLRISAFSAIQTIHKKLCTEFITIQDWLAMCITQEVLVMPQEIHFSHFFGCLAINFHASSLSVVVVV